MKTYTGEIQITNELTLNNPTMEIITVQYDWVNNTASIEIHFKEPNSALTHSRNFDFELEDKDYLHSDIVLLVANHEILGQFN